jgi:acyl dehydratase
LVSYETALAHPPVRVEQTYTVRDTALYALGVGLGQDPLDRHELRYLYEDGIAALPTMGVVLGSISMRKLTLGIDYGKMVHGDQHLKLHRRMPTATTILGETRVVDVIDRGVGKGALVRLVREITDLNSGEAIATSTMTLFCRGDGGFGGPQRLAPAIHPIPDRAPDQLCVLRGDRRSALIYRLSGDYNPLHIDPEVAAAAGFSQPILHGLCTFGMVGHAVLKTVLAYDESRLLELGGRFSSPVMPGETLEVALWVDAHEISIRVRAIERDLVVFNNGRAVISA